MFIVFNKEQIYSYFIVLSTVIVLLFMASIISDRNLDTTLTSSPNKLLPIYNVKTE